MTILTKDSDLAAFCARATAHDAVYVDTEFMRERTYYAQTCLIQLGLPDGTAVAVDMIAAPDIDLSPLATLFANPAILKVLHASRQDIEIFWQIFGAVPAPLFDSQIAAMALGFPDQVSFDTLCRHYAKKAPDKSQQFTDWTRRPLTPAQLDYALDDVRLLVAIHRGMAKDLEEKERTDWIAPDMQDLQNPKLYQVIPDDAWKRLKFRDAKPVALAVARELCKWREDLAIQKNVPRGRVLKDEVIQELSLRQPKTPQDMANLRGVPGDVSRSAHVPLILAAIKRGQDCPADQRPTIPKYEPFPHDKQAVLEMLKLLHKVTANQHHVTPRLLATTDELEAVARVPAALGRLGTGWRYDVFGQNIEKLVSGRLALHLSKTGEIVQAEI